MATWNEGGGLDPEFGHKVGEAFGGKRDRPLLDAIVEGWGDIFEGMRNRPQSPDIESPGEPVRPLEEEIAEGLEGYRSREPDVTGGANEYGAEVPGDPNEARPGMRPTSTPAPYEGEEEEEPNLTAEVDYILGGGVNDAYSRLRRAIGAESDKDMGQKLAAAYSEVTGENPTWRSGMDALDVISDPVILEAVLGAM